MSKHTPGPWDVDTVIGDNHEHDIICDVRERIPGAGFPTLVASVYSDDPQDSMSVIPRKQGTANARLIAAAPDLLAACKSIISMVPTLCCDDFHHEPDDYHTGIECPVEKRWELALKDMRAAIAKAEGEA